MAEASASAAFYDSWEIIVAYSSVTFASKVSFSALSYSFADAASVFVEAAESADSFNYASSWATCATISSFSFTAASFLVVAS